jgi:hypothetical protein
MVLRTAARWSAQGSFELVAELTNAIAVSFVSGWDHWKVDAEGSHESVGY